MDHIGIRNIPNLFIMNETHYINFYLLTVLSEIGPLQDLSVTPTNLSFVRKFLRY
jgi:hypothetical protein